MNNASDLLFSFIFGISTGVFVSVKHSAASFVWAVSSSKGIQDSSEVCGVGINDSGRKSFEVSRAFGRTGHYELRRCSVVE